MERFVLGLDVGTTSVSVVPVTEAGRVLTGRSREHRAGIPAENPWESLQDPGKLLDAARELLQETLDELGSPAAIGVCSQMHGPVYMNGRGEAVSPVYTWLDGRGNLPVPGRPGESREGGPVSYAAYLSEITGTALSSGFAVVTHHVLQAHDAVPPEAEAIGTAGDFVAAALAGRSRPLMDASQAHSFGAYDVSRDGWNLEAVRQAGLSPALLPDLVPAGTVLGNWSGTPGTPVTSCLGDNQASFLGAAREFMSDGVLSLGTSGQISVHLGDSESPHPAIDIRPFPAGGYLAVGASLTGGKAYQTLRDFLDDVCVRLAGARPEGVDYSRLNDLAQELMESLRAENRSVLQDPRLPRVDTRFLGARSEPEARASISNLSPWNFTVGNLALGVLSGMIEELYGMFELLPEAVRTGTRRVCLTGNALRRNPVLQELAGLHFRLPTYIPGYTEEAAVGAALIAGVGTGVWPGYEEACRAVASGETP